MDQINGVPPAPRPPARWPLTVFIAVVAVAVIGAVAVAALRHASPQASATLTATPTGQSAVGPPSTSTPAAQATATATSSARVPAGTRPTNPTSMRVVDGSCTVHQISWTWSGAGGATSYDVVIYNPITHAVVHDTHTAGSTYTLGANLGATVALKVRSRNSTGTPGTYFTPGDTGRVPPQTTNPTQMTVTTSGRTLTWFWTGAQHATAYDVVLYHYDGGTAKSDITGHTATAHWGLRVTPGGIYYLKVRAVGTCAPTTFYTPARAARVGA